MTNPTGLQGISLAEPDDFEIKQSNLNGLFTKPTTHTTFIDGMSINTVFSMVIEYQHSCAESGFPCTVCKMESGLV